MRKETKFLATGQTIEIHEDEILSKIKVISVDDEVVTLVLSYHPTSSDK